MKTRIIGSILVVVVLAALYLVTGGDTSTQPTVPTFSPSASDAAFKGLSVN